jgi:hypothetical protein
MSRFAIPRPGAPLLIAVLATAAAIGTIDPAGSYPELGEGPGITLDEFFNVDMGVYQWHALRDHGWRLWTPEVRNLVFSDKNYNPDHPPLGRLWLGMWHDLARWLWPPVETGAPTVTACARVGSAVAFGITVWLIGTFAARWFGSTAGWSSALCYALMPRVLGHAHLAALETCMNLAFLAPILYVGQKWGATNPADGRPLRPKGEWLCAIIAGVLIGAAFLTKIQAVLLPIPITIWTLYRWCGRGVAWLAVAGITTAAVFFLGWPWLQIDPLAHIREYLGRGVERQTLNCWYFGQKYADVDVPWHYPFVMFAVTVPLGALILGACGAIAPLASRARQEAVQSNASPLTTRPVLLFGTTLFILAFFALPGITVYDGTRLFLIACPLWAMLAGAGVQVFVEELSRRQHPKFAIVATILLLTVHLPTLVRLHPCELSYYNLAVGGLSGANRLGLERTYWQDSFTRSFLRDVVRHVPQGATLYLAPRFHPVQELDLLLQSPILVAHDVKILPYDDPIRDQIKYVIVFRRRADQWDSLEPAPVEGKLLAEVTRSGVQLAVLYELP